jgi:HAD superfamily hydrolase (TIGR01509 family)
MFDVRNDRQPDVLLLDVMGTLVHDPIFDAVPAFFGCDVRGLFRRLDPEAWYAFERGELEEAEFFARWMRDPLPFEPEALRGCLRGAYRLLDGIEPLLADLRGAGVPMHALSNYPVWYRLIEQVTGLSRFVSWRFVSCHTGVRKPDPRAYAGAAETLGVHPARCVFVDDRADNVAAAEAVGMTGIVFDDAAGLRARLEALGLLEGCAPPGDGA